MADKTEKILRFKSRPYLTTPPMRLEDPLQVGDTITLSAEQMEAITRLAAVAHCLNEDLNHPWTADVLTNGTVVFICEDVRTLANPPSFTSADPDR